jgi:signal peptidase
MSYSWWRWSLFTIGCITFAAWFITLRPAFLGGPAGYIIVSGRSMEPTLWTDDLVITRTQSSYQVGDVVAFRVEGGNVIHRIVGGNGVGGFEMKGDNNGWVDEWRPTIKDIVGKQWLEIDGAGSYMTKLREPRWFATVIAGMASFTIIGGNEVRKRRRGGRQMLRQLRSNDVKGAGASSNGPLAAPGWAVAGLGVAGVLALALGVAAFVALRTPETKTRNVVQAKWENTANFDYSLVTAPSTLYPTGLIGPVSAAPAVNGQSPDVASPPIYTKGVRRLDLGFRYALSSDLPPAVRGELSADLLIKAQGEGGWTKTSQLLAPLAFEGATAQTRFVVDFDPVQNIIETIEKETGFAPSAYDLVITPRVAIIGKLGAQAIEEVYAPAFTLKYSKTTITADSALRRSEPKSIGAPVVEPQNVSFFSIDLSVPNARLIYGGATLVALALAALFAAVVFLGVGQDEATQVRTRYGMKLVPVTESQNTTSNRVQVARLQDLAVLASRDGKIIFNQKLPNGELYFVPDGAVTYEYSRLDAVKGA